MDERTQGAMLLAVGGVALRLGLTDAALAYVKASLQPLLIVAGAVLVVLGAVALVRAFRDQPDAHADIHLVDDGHGHDHGGQGPRVAWLLTLPLLALLLIAPPPLGAFAASRQSTALPTAVTTTYPPLPAATAGAVELNLSEFVFRGLYDEAESLAGARVRLVGFVTPATDGSDYQLTRFALNCCAADGTAINVAVQGDTNTRTVDEWLEIEGTWQPRPGEAPGEPSSGPPILVADTVTPISQPDQPYE